MQGAREYYDLFNTGQYGKLYILTGAHSRGKTFRIYVMPKNIDTSVNWHHKDAIEVYGVISGNPGWTESYGWLHVGPWVVDFNKLVEEKKKEQKEKFKEYDKEQADLKIKEQVRVKNLLDQY